MSQAARKFVGNASGPSHRAFQPLLPPLFDQSPVFDARSACSSPTLSGAAANRNPDEGRGSNLPRLAQAVELMRQACLVMADSLSPAITVAEHWEPVASISPEKSDNDELRSRQIRYVAFDPPSDTPSLEACTSSGADLTIHGLRERGSSPDEVIATPTIARLDHPVPVVAAPAPAAFGRCKPFLVTICTIDSADSQMTR